MKKLFGLLVLLVVLLVLLFGIYSVAPVRPIFTPATQDVQVKTAQMHEQGESYTIDVQYPQFGISPIDSHIRKVINDAVEAVKGYPANPPESATPKNSLDAMFDKIYVGPDIVSVELLLSEYTGGAHPFTSHSGFAFNRTTGKQLELNDALKLTGLTLAELSSQATTKLRTQMGESFLFPEGADSNPENFSSFVVTPDSVVFIFQPYQVGPYAAGPQEVSFPRK